MARRSKILICGVLPPPYFGHSVMYKMLMESSFIQEQDVRFLNMHFWSYQTDKKVTSSKIVKMFKYYVQYVWTILIWQPKYVLYNSSFYKMPFWKDFLFCGTGIVLGRKIVFHDFGQYVAELDQSLSGLKKKLLRWMIRHAAGSIVMGENVRPTYHGLMDDRRVVVVPGVVEDTASIEVAPDRPSDDFINVLYFSHMSKPKGVFVAFAAAALILDANRKTMITFAGPVESEEVALGLERLQKEHPGRVRYLGYIEDAKERTSIFRGADIFMFSTLRDVFGLVLLHAMAEGKPVVASREGTIPEIIDDNVNGLLFTKGNERELADKVLALAADTGLRQRFGEVSRRKFVLRYAPDVYAKSMTQAFEQLEAIQ